MKIAAACAGLEPFQSFEYDPESGIATIITEVLVSSVEPERITEILARRRVDEKITVTRQADTYKVALTRQIKILLDEGLAE